MRFGVTYSIDGRSYDWVGAKKYYTDQIERLTTLMQVVGGPFLISFEVSMSLYAPIDTSTSGANKIVTGVAGKTIRVLGYTLVGAGTVTAQWKSGTTEISGAMSLAVASVISPSQGPIGPADRKALMVTNVGDDLNLVLGGSVQVSGHIEYEFRLL